jgi:hypothetical protein
MMLEEVVENKKETPSHKLLNATGIEPVTIWISVTIAKLHAGIRHATTIPSVL